MTFDQKTTVVGQGRVTGARNLGSRGIGLIFTQSGALVYRRINEYEKRPAYQSGRIIGYADEGYLLDRGFIEKGGGFRYVSDKLA